MLNDKQDHLSLPLALPMDRGRVGAQSLSALPLEMRLGPGLFGARRGLSTPPPPGQLTLIRFHEAVDLLCAADEEVFAVADGRVIESGGDRIVVLHRPFSAGYLTRYVHLGKRLVAANLDVEAGQQLGLVAGSTGSIPTHLHFELRRLTEPPDLSALSGTGRSIALDPTMLLYRWEGVNYFSENQHQRTTGPRLIDRIGVRWEYGVSFLSVSLAGVARLFDIPLYASSADTQHLITLLETAFHQGRTVSITSRDSRFFGPQGDSDRQVIIAVELQG